MNQQLKDAYEQLNNMHPDLFKGCPAEVPGVEVKKNATARQFDACTDAGLCFEDEFFEREPSSLTADASEVEQESSEGSTIYIRNRYATPEDIERVVNKIRSHYVRYDDTRKTEGERAFKSSQASSSCQVEPGLTGTGSPELNVQPFDGYKDTVPLRSLKVYVEDRCATQWVDGDSSSRSIPHFINCWLSTCLPGPNSVTEHLENGLQEQLSIFGRKIFIPLKNASSPKKFQVKEKALVNALWRAFSPRQKYASDSTLSLDTCPIEGNEAAWTPVTESPMDVMLHEERQERRARRARHELVKVRDYLGGDKWVLLMESLRKTNAQIAHEINSKGGDTNTAAIQKRVRRVRNALQQLGCPF
jgi:hypothetical protein